MSPNIVIIFLNELPLIVHVVYTLEQHTENKNVLINSNSVFQNEVEIQMNLDFQEHSDDNISKSHLLQH